MPRPLKYLEGDRITDPLDAIKEILAGRYIIDGGKRQHPSWMGAQQLHQIKIATDRGHLRFAIPNPEHPDNKEPQK